MSSARQVKQRIATAKNISKITKAMEMVSASKMRKAQEKALNARAYSQAIISSLHLLSENSDASLHPLLKINQSGDHIAVIISTDRGLCGNLNQAMFKALINWKKTYENGYVLAVGKKAIQFCQYYGIAIHAQFTNIEDNVSTSDITPISQMLINGYINNQYQTVTIFYTNFVNTLTQKPIRYQLLPLQSEKIKEDLTPIDTNQHAEYIFEPSSQEILNSLLPFYVENTIFQSFLESKASEHSARMVTMKNASDNAREVVSELQLISNKQRQASITSELLDITTATVSLQN